MDNENSIMTRQRLESLLKNGESFNIEYKTCRNNLSGSVFETVCAFSNRYGGFILLGVNDNGSVSGVEPQSVAHIKKDFINTLNNPNKIRPSMFLNLEETEYDGKIILWVYVPVTSELQFCDNKIFDRNGDADQDITKSVDLVANIINRKSHTYYEREIFPYVTTEHLRMDLIPMVKRLAMLKNARHPWKDMDEMQLLRSAGLYEENLMTGRKGFNLAAILLFGKDETILSCLPTYKTDAIFRDKNPDRYDDRLIVETNLIESYDLLMGFVQKHTDDRFFLIDNLASSVRDKIAREVIVNTLAHREYSSAFPAKLIITKNELYTENWNRAATFGRLTPHNFTPYPKNPLIAKFFVQLGFADSLGSGVRNLYKYSKIYSDSEPLLEEGDVFKTTLKLYVADSDDSRNDEDNQSPNKLPNKSPNKFPNKLSDAVIRTYNAIVENPYATNSELSVLLGLSARTIREHINSLKNENLIVRQGAKKNGYWKVIPNKYL